MKHVKLFEEFINEARTIEKIEKDRTRVINDMAEMVTNWKAAKASGDKEAETSFLQTLKDLTEEKKKYEKEINAAIANKDRYIELVISEHNIIFESVMSEIDLLAKEAKNFKDFLKAFKADNQFKGLTDAGDAKEFEAWLKTVYDSAKNESLSEGETATKFIQDHWFDIYGEKFINEYPKVAKILKNRPNIDRRELARIWDEVYGEDFKKEYPEMWDAMDEETVYERNAFLAARAKAIEEDLEEFEFNGKTYPVLNKPS
jgi:predicted DNA binding CopG/RHH family protein